MKAQTLWTIRAMSPCTCFVSQSPGAVDRTSGRANDTAAAANSQWVLITWTVCACEKTLSFLTLAMLSKAPFHRVSLEIKTDSLRELGTMPPLLSPRLPKPSDQRREKGFQAQQERMQPVRQPLCTQQQCWWPEMNTAEELAKCLEDWVQSSSKTEDWKHWETAKPDIKATLFKHPDMMKLAFRVYIRGTRRIYKFLNIVWNKGTSR